MRQVISVPTSFSSSAASRVPLRLAGMKARTPTSTARPPLTTSVTVPTTAVFSAKAASSADQSRGWRYFEARELVVVLLIAAGDGDGEGVAGLDAVGVVFEGRARQHAFGLVADVEEDLVGGEGDDRALQLLLAGLGFMGVGRLEVLEQGAEVFYRVFGGSRRRRRFNRGGGGRCGRGFLQRLNGLGDDGGIGLGCSIGCRFGQVFWGWQGLFEDGIRHNRCPLHSPTVLRTAC